MLVGRTHAVDAIVMQSDVERARTTRRPALWRARIQYRWQYEGAWYTGDRYARTETVFRKRSDAWKIARRFTGDQRVRAWVDRTHPAEAVLDRTPNFFPYLFLFVTAVLMALFRLISDPRSRHWSASGPGWSLDVQMQGSPQGTMRTAPGEPAHSATAPVCEGMTCAGDSEADRRALG